MPSVLHVSQPRDGGVAWYVADAATDQLARGWDVTVACAAQGWLAAELARRGVPHREWTATRAPGPSVPGETWQLRRVIAEVAPDLVHLHSSKAGLAGRLVLRGSRPTLFQPHGWSWLAATGTVAALSLRWELLAARWADRCVCVGEGEAEHARAAGFRGRLAVVRNGVDLRRYAVAGPGERESVRAALGLDASPLAVCPARWARQKGQDVLLAAWPRIQERRPDARLALVGGDVPGDVVLPAGVRSVGEVSDMRPWLVAADVVVLPSRWEGLSLALLEALAVGRSTVVSDIPGLREVVDARTGAVVPPDRPDVLADAVAARLADPELARAEGAAAAARAPELDVRRTFDRLAELTTAVLAERVSSRTAP